MPATTHAVLGASSAHRWMTCLGSPREIRKLPKSERNRSSVYAQEGTAAHYLGERCLGMDEEPEQYRGWWISDSGYFQDAKSTVDEEMASGHWFEVGDEMIEAIEMYVIEIRGHLDRLPGSELLLEQTVFPLPGREKELYGTGDAMVIQPFGELVVGDFKYGKGVQVDIDWNDQLMYYGLGALRAVGEYDVSHVTLVIIQPRGIHEDGPVRRWTVSVEALLDFSDQLASAADATKEPDAPLVPGKHCQFCPAAARCPALRQLVVQEAIAEFPDDVDVPTIRLPEVDNPTDLARAKAVADVAEFWAREVNALLQRALETGMEVPGFKLVRGRANRAWKDPSDVERRLKNKAGVKTGDIYSRKLRSPRQIERVVGKDWVADHAYKPEGGLTVARSSDLRTAEAAPILDFTDASTDAQLAAGTGSTEE